MLHYARIVKDHALLRRLLDTTRDIQDDVFAHRGDPHELIERAEQRLFKIAHDERHGRVALDRGRPPRGDRQARGALAQGRRPHRHAVRLQRPRRPHRRLPARQPDRAGRAARRWASRALVTNIAENAARRARHAGGAVLARDVRDRARAALHRLAGQGRRATSCARAGSRPTAGRRCVKAAEKLAEAPLCIDDSSDIGILELRAKARRLHAQRSELGLIDRRLPPADAARGPRRQPRRAGRPDQPRAEDPGARARDPGDRGLAALARGRVAPRQAAAALRPARERPDRAGRRPRDVHLPRRVLQPRVRAPGRGRHHHRQAPQRPGRRTSRSPSCRAIPVREPLPRPRPPSPCRRGERDG